MSLIDDIKLRASGYGYRRTKVKSVQIFDCREGQPVCIDRRSTVATAKKAIRKMEKANGAVIQQH